MEATAMSAKKGANQWLEIIESVTSNKTEAEPIPEGFKMIPQIAEETGKTRGTVRKRLVRLMEQGKVEMRMIRHIAGRGREAHYKIIK